MSWTASLSRVGPTSHASRHGPLSILTQLDLPPPSFVSLDQDKRLTC